MIDKKELKKKMLHKFNRDYKKYYPIKALDSLGFKRFVCQKCGKGFWATEKRGYCDEPACSDGYRFIGEKATWKKFKYKDVWDTFVNVMKKWDYTPIKRCPVVARWYDQLYFVDAGINNFQPYVISGAVPPPADTTLEAQFCLRFNDIDNVGLTGRHYTGFVMLGQHVFNRPNKELFFKDEALVHLFKFFKRGMGIKKDELFLHEDSWAGGGNFGPSIEFFSRGLELANQVYIQYGVTAKGEEELKTRVVDMGAGLNRLAWFSQGVPMSYDVVFPMVMKYLYNQTGIKPKKDIWKRFARYAGIIDVDEGDVAKQWGIVSKKTGFDVKTLKKEIAPIKALYSIADHTRSLLIAIHDGALPSNVGGGYNLRNILRRCYSLIDGYKWKIDLDKVFELHMKEFGSWFTELNNYGSLFKILDVEKKRYGESRKRGLGLINKMKLKKESFNLKTLLKLYDSHGITPELVKEITKIDIPSNFYAKVQELHKPEEKEVEKYDSRLAKLPNTIKTYNYKPHQFEFKAKVIDIIGNNVVLDQTLFYPRSGGQDWDLGTINKIPVKSVTIQYGTVVHELEKKPIFSKGGKITGKVDSERRRLLSMNHTGAHIIGYAARKVLGQHIHQAGSEKTIKKGRLDVTHYESISFDDMQKIEKEANTLIKKKVSVVITTMSRDKAEKKFGMDIYQGGAVPGKELRIVQIGKYDVQACGGIHVKNIKDIKFIKIINTERIKDGIVRLEFMTGDAALKKVQEDEKVLRDLGKLWSVSYKEVYKTGKRFFEEWKTQKSRLDKMQKGIATKMIELAVNNKIKEITIPVDDFGPVAKALGPFKSKINNLLIIGNSFAIALSEKDAVAELKKICRVVKGNKREAHGFNLKN